MFTTPVSKLAEILVNYSVSVKSGDKVLITADHSALPLAEAVYKLVLSLGAYPHLVYSAADLDYFYFKTATNKQLTTKPEISLFLANWADKFIRLYASLNTRSLSQIDPDRLMLKAKTDEPVKNVMLKKPWLLTEYPSQSMAQSSGLSLSQLEEVYFSACLQDWPTIAKKLTKLKHVLDRAKTVEVIGKDTHLTLSFTGRLFQIGDGKYNMPDGEVFGAPLDQSTNGHIFFDLPSLRSGNIVSQVHLEFKQGKVVKAQAQTGNDYLQKALKTDAGSSRLGEFALGANYGIKSAMLNTLFDEKIGGTLHMALGSAYPDKLGGGVNRSAIHWDIVKDMRLPGSTVLVNGKALLKNGKLIF